MPARVFSNSPLALFFLGEIADSPFASPRTYFYAQGVLEPALDCQGERCWHLLAQALESTANQQLLHLARTEREQSIFNSFTIAAQNVSGEAVHLRIIPRPLWDNTGTATGSSASIEDITDIKNELQELRTTGLQYQILFENFPIGLCVYDENGHILSANPAARNIMNFTSAEYMDKRVEDLPWRALREDGSPMQSEEYPTIRARLTGEFCFNKDVGLLHETDTGDRLSWYNVMAAPLPSPARGIVTAYVDVTARKKGQEELRVKERRYRLAVEAGMMGVWEWNLKTGELHLDPWLKTMLGYDSGEIPDDAESWFELIHPEDRPLHEKCVRDHLLGEAISFENEHRKLRKDGGVSWILSRGASWREGVNGPMILSGADLDITQRKQAEQAAEVERRRLFRFLDRLPAFVCAITADYRITFGNSYFKEIFGTIDPNKPCHVNLHGLDSPCEQCPVQEVFETRSLSIWEWTSTENGKSFQIFTYPFEDIDGGPLVLELGIDITASKKAQKALRASEERYRGITENLDLALAIIDPDGFLRTPNPKLKEWFSHLDLNTPLRCRDLFPNEPLAIGGLESPLELTRIFRRPRQALWDAHLAQGTRRMQVSFNPIFNSDGTVRSVVFMAEDVTEKLELQEWLQRAQKLEALGTLAGGIAHEINQPLNALRLYASGLELLLEKPLMPKREILLTRLGWILRETSRISDIIKHMRALVRQESVPNAPKVANLNESVSAALSLLQAQLQAHDVTLRTELDESLPPVRGNPMQIEQVVINLAVNAMQALDSCPSSTAEGDGASKTLLLRTTIENNRPALWVEDNGPGLGPNKHRVFDPFYTSKDVGQGMGLGLSIVHTFIRSWNAEVHARDSELGGACFLVIFLPAPPESVLDSKTGVYTSD